MHVSPCQPRSSIFATPKAIPALIFSALKPGGREGSEKSTVSGFWPTNKMRVIDVSPFRRRGPEIAAAPECGNSDKCRDYGFNVGVFRLSSGQGWYLAAAPHRKGTVPYRSGRRGLNRLDAEDAAGM